MGVVEADAVLGPERVTPGDAVVAMASSGFHSNGYSLVRRVVAAAGLDLHATPAGLARPLGDELLEPTRIYARDCLDLVTRFGVEGVHAFAHITGGLAGNAARVVPDGLEAVLDRSTWELPAAVRLMEEHGVPRVGVRARVQLRRRHGRRGVDADMARPRRPADRRRRPLLGGGQRRHARGRQPGQGPA